MLIFRLKFRSVSIFLCAAVLLVGIGCDCRKKSNVPNALFSSPEESLTDTLRKQEVFDRSLELLGSLEEYPCLPAMPGAERLVQTADRLDKWIQDEKEEEDWKRDETIFAMETAAKRTAETADEIVRLLHRLQGKEDEKKEESKENNGEPGKDDGKAAEPVAVPSSASPPAPSASLAEEQARTTELLTRLDKELKDLAVQFEISDIAAFSQSIESLQQNFANLSKIKNANVRAFARQLDNQTRQIANVADNLQRFASDLRQEGLFVSSADVDYLKQCVWARNISNWARGEKQPLLDRVVNLFDWTVCNVDLRDRSITVGNNSSITLPQQYPWQSLVLGKSTVWDRVWVFMELLRQQRIDSCLLSIPHPKDPKQSLIWAVGVLLDNEVYLFLPYHGVPLPGPNGPSLAENGALSFDKVATLSQVLKDDRLFRQLDLSETQKFPLTSEMIQKTTIYLLATPQTNSMRMKVLEGKLSGDQNMVLYTDLKEQRRLFGLVPSIQGVEIWKYPYRTMFEQLLLVGVTNDLMAAFLIPHPKTQSFPLWTGRILYFKGKLTGQESAMTYYQEARIPDRDIMEFRNQAEFRNNPLIAQRFHFVTLNATYWLGLTSFEIDSISSAKDYFIGRETSIPNPWASGILYMMGRVAEREKKYEEAIQFFERPTQAPTMEGNLLRAKWLREKTGKPVPAKQEPSDPKPES